MGYLVLQNTERKNISSSAKFRFLIHLIIIILHHLPRKTLISNKNIFVLITISNYFSATLSTCNSQQPPSSFRHSPSSVLPMLFVALLNTISWTQELTFKQCNAGQNCCYNDLSAYYNQHSSTCLTGSVGSLVGQCPCDTTSGAKDIRASPTCVSNHIFVACFCSH